MAYKDPDKQRAYQRDWVSARREERNRQLRIRRAEFIEWCQSLKAGKPCADCGESYHPAAMHWDHLPGFQKLGGVRDLARNLNKKTVLDEIAKCELVCANCHAVRTYERTERTPESFVYAS